MDGHSRDARPAQLLDHPVRPVLGVGEDQHAVQGRLLQDMLEQKFFVALVHLVQPLLNGVHRGRLGRHLHADRVDEDRPGQLRNLLGHGGGKQQRLPLLRQPGDDLAHVVDKAHIQHPVRLVQDKNLHAAQIDMPLAAQVVEAARRGGQHVHALLQGLHLGPLSHAAEDDRVADGEVFAVQVEILLDLQGQLPCGRQDQGADGALCCRAAVLFQLAIQILQDGNGEGRRLAGARLGAANQVAARQHRRDGGGLDGGGFCIVHLMDCF